MTTDDKARRYADEALKPRTRGLIGTIRHITQGAAYIATGALLAACDAASVAAEALIPGATHEREDTR